MKNLTAVIYARYSTEQQRDTSIDDQVRICRNKAATLNFDVVEVRSDAAISGASHVAARPGGQAVLEDAMAGRMQVLLVEGLDRLSRDLVEQETIVRRLEHRGIRILGVADGYDTENGAIRKLARGVRGLINEAYLDDLRHKTHRGLAGQVERGFHAGGLSYGYKSVPVDLNDRGEARGYKLVVNEEQAAVVRRIFVEFSHGLSCQQIAHGLNADGIRGPRSPSWGVSALYGTPKNGSGLLNNELYIGRMIWNRSRWVTDPDSHRRGRRLRPREEWIVEQHPELRIVDDDTWQLVRERLDRARTPGWNAKRSPTKRTLLGGLLRCSKCRGRIIAVDRYTYACANAKDRGRAVCSGMRAPRRALHVAILRYLRVNLSGNDIRERIEVETESTLGLIKARLLAKDERRLKRASELEAELNKIVDAIARVGVSTTLAERLKEGEAELAECRKAPQLVTFDSNLVGVIVQRKLDELSAVLDRDIGLARSALWDLLDGSTLIQEDGQTLVAIHGSLDRIPVSTVEASIAG
jgi:DNA invertase Pin-like site-specific DNA recombinase